jgi:hypothetical protein
MRLQNNCLSALGLLVCSIAGFGYTGINEGGRNRSRFRAFRAHPVQQYLAVITDGAIVPNDSSGE